MFRLAKFPDGECGWIRYCDSFIEASSFKPLINNKIDGFEEKLIQSKEVKKLVDFLVREAKINHANPKELGLPEFRIVVREDGTAYGHVMNRSSETVDFKLQL